MTAHFRLPPIKAPKVLEHARGQPCTLRFPGICCGGTETTVFAHLRDRHKGMGQKASDHSGCFACFQCHTFLDQGLLPEGFRGHVPTKEEITEACFRALRETWEVLIRDKVIIFPVVEPKPAAAKLVPKRKPPEQRQKIPGRSEWPKGQKFQSRNNLRRKPRDEK